MGINVSTSMGFENREFLKSAAKNILQKGGAESEKASQIAQRAIFGERSYSQNSQYSILSASTQITLNNSLKETLKYLNSHANKKVAKKPVLGELWEIFSATNESSEQNPYKGELIDFEINLNQKNIFAA